MPTAADRPVVLCFSGHDPIGGAGIQADIEAIARFGCHACTVITSLTVQDSVNVQAIHPLDTALFMQQARCVIEDVRPAVIKIGLLGSSDIAAAVAALLEQIPNVPVVLDPVLAAGGGYALTGGALLNSMVELLLPRTTLLTPNTHEAVRLSGGTDPGEDIDACAARLLAHGCRHVLITGTHAQTEAVINRLYSASAGNKYQAWRWDRLPHSYHGSGCTLAAATAAGLATGLSVERACEHAQSFTWQALSNGFRPGRGQHLPNRSVAGPMSADASARRRSGAGGMGSDY
jgi:hydroxymethylpyrimidine/phosphomethylpyrimidine kinase